MDHTAKSGGASKTDGIDIKKIILVSNSIPKSGSTLLFENQNQLFQKAFGTPPSEQILDASSLDNMGGWVNLQQGALLDLIRDPGYDIGPVVIKTHFVPSDELLDEMTRNGHVFMSLSVRHPIDVFLSARDNFYKRGEFVEFEDTETGILTINKYFSDIYSHTMRLNQRYPQAGSSDFRITPVRYEDIVTDTSLALKTSLPQGLKDILSDRLRERGSSLESVFNEFSFEKIKARTQHRLQVGAVKRDHSKVDPDLLSLLKDRLKDTIRLFGY